MVKVAVFASGNGSNFENLVLQEKKQKNYEIKMLLTDKKNSYAVKRSENLGIKSYIVELKDFKNKDEYENKIIEILKDEDIDLIVLGGYMKIISPVLLREYEGKIINIHPSYLPNYQGKDAIERCFLDKNKETGVTIHYVDQGVDTGKIIYQEKIEIERLESLESLEKKIHQLEYEIYPKILTRICSGGEIK